MPTLARSRMMHTRYTLTAVIMIGLVLTASCGNTTPASTTVAPSGSPVSESPSGQEGARTRPTDGMTMVYVPGGEFRMGTTWSLSDRVHSVSLDSFWIDRTEVTNAHYGRCVAAGACPAPAT